MPKMRDPFERAERWLVVTLLALAIIVVFGSVVQRSQQQLALEPSSLLLPPAITLEPYPPPIQMPPPTLTPGPYPPPTRTPAPTIPTPTVTTTPTPVPTPLAFTTSKLGIIWVETTRITTEVGPNQPGTSTFWRANIADLTNRMGLVTMPQGYSVKNASLSSDGSKIAFTTLPPPPNSRWWLLGTLWVMNVDGSELRELAQGIFPGGWLGPYPLWSPDSRTLAYVKSVPKVPPPVDKDTEPDSQEIYILDAANGEGKLLVADDYITRLLGWSLDTRLLFYERRVPGTGYELWAVDASGEMSPQCMMPLPEYYEFSPDGTKLLFFTAEEGLIMLSVDGKDREVLLPPEQAFGGIWSADGTEFIGRRGYELQLRALDVSTGTARTLPARLVDDDRLLSVSPDKQWLAVQGYSTRRLSFLWIGSVFRVEVPGIDSLYGPLYFVGWVVTDR